jgi:catechol 2,3-dioxygenase-like lactoylglutathione lyase family enzyme
MIIGAHVILFSTDADADRAFVREVLGFPHVDAGGGWLIFALPPGELAVHPGEASSHELMLMTDDVEGLVAQLGERGVACSEIHRERWGSITRVTLPSGAPVGVYQPTHPSPLA